jgi:aminocarboxymuconate-semialdehyde decarboxylase|tara:strand:- start:421 stop:1395 length:975 start_codon:yes stop_codon:yes gene_type:complete
MHAHHVPPATLKAVEDGPSRYGVHLEATEAGRQCLCFDYGLKLRPFFDTLLDLEKRWETMDRQGVDRQVLSGWTDLFGYEMPPEEGALWHRLMNERLGEVAQKHSGRVSMLASVPLQDADLAAAELEHGIKQCGAVGGVIAASVKGANLGEADLDRFWAAAVELDVPLFIHPTQPIPDPRAIKHGMVIIAQFLYDSTLTAGSLVFSGALDRFPKLNLILPHGGGFFPYQAGRFDRIYRNLGPQAAPAQPPSAYLSRFYYDTILHHPAALGYLRDMVGSQQLLMGTDYPFPVDDQAPLQMLEETGFPAGEIAQISGDNARRLFRI